MKKNIVGFLAFMLLCAGLMGLGARAEGSYQYGNWEYTLENGLATVIRYSGEETAVVIPEYVNGYPVRVVGNGQNPVVYAYNTSATSVSGPQQITISAGTVTIAANAFYGQAIRSVTIPSTVTSIGDGAFYNTWLTEVDIPGSVVTIGESAFCSNMKLRNITLHEGLKQIGKEAFSGCGTEAYYDHSSNTVPEITIPETVEVIGDSAFSGTPLTAFAFPEGLISVGEKILSFNNAMRSVTLPDDWTEIPDGLFSSYMGRGTITVPAGVTRIGDRAFLPNSFGAGLKYSIVLPSGITEIGDRAFYGNKSAFSGGVSFSGITRIGERALYGCGAEVVELPAQGVTLGESFTDATVKTDLSGAIGQWLVSQGGYSLIDSAHPDYKIHTENGKAVIDQYIGSDADISIPASFGAYPTVKINQYTYSYTEEDEDGDEYTQTQTKGAFEGLTAVTSVTIPNTVTDIAARAFYGCNHLEDVQLPSSLQSIGDYAFSSCSLLLSIDFPVNLKSIGTGAFSSCVRLASVVLPDNLESFGSNVFYGCRSLESFSLPACFTEIPASFFSGMTGLREITLHSGVTAVGEKAFSGCTALESIVIPASVSTIGTNAFQNCSSLLSATLPSQLGEIPANAFLNCSRLEQITIPASVTTVGDSAFSGCSALTTITIPDSSRLTGIGNNAFLNCGELKAITLPNTVISIGAGAFQNCGNMTHATFGNKLNTIGDNVFANCASLTSVTLPSSLRTIGASAFSGCVSLSSFTGASGVTAIGNNAFSGCTSLKEMVVSANVSTLGTAVFPEGILLYTLYNDTTYSKLKNLTGINLIGYARVSNNWQISKYQGTLEELVIPDRIGTASLSVTSIGSGAFQATGLKKLILPEGVNSIYSSAFSGSAIRDINLPSTVTSIGASAFKNCTGLTALTIPEGVTVLNNELFSGCTALKELNLPSGLTSIGNSTFSYTGLTELHIPNSVTSIGNTPFSLSSDNLYIYLPENLNSLDTSYTFQGTYVVRADSGTGQVLISKHIRFVDPTWPDWKILVLSDTQVELQDYIGEDTDTLVIPSALGSRAVFGLNILSDHPGIKGVTLPDSLTELNGLSGCSGLGGVNLPDGINYIARDSLPEGCMLYYLTGTETAQTVARDYYQSLGYSVTNEKATVEKAIQAKAGIFVIPSEVNGYPVAGIGNSAFVNPFPHLPNLLQGVVIPSSVKTIGAYAFRDDTELESVTIADGVTFIDYGAFYGCTALRELTLPSTLATMRNDVFYGAGNESTVIHLPAGVSGMSADAFSGYSGWIDCPAGTLSATALAKDGSGNLSGRAFIDQTNAPGWVLKAVTNSGKALTAAAYIGEAGSGTTITVPGTINGATVISLADDVLAGKPISSIVFTEGLQTIGSRAFKGHHCSSLTMPSSLRRIGDSAFAAESAGYYAAPLETLVLNEGLTEIGAQAFYNCYRLRSVSLPDSLRTIGNKAFYCINASECLPELLLPDHMNSIGSDIVGATSGSSKLYVRAGTSTMNSLPQDTYFYDPDYPHYRLKLGSNGELWVTVVNTASGTTVIPATIREVPVTVFSGISATNVTDLILSEGIVRIDSVMGTLNSVCIPSTVTLIDGSAFRYLRGTDTLVFPDHVTFTSTINIPSGITVFSGVNTQTARNLGSTGFHDVKYPGVLFRYTDNENLHLVSLDEGCSSVTISRYVTEITENALSSATEISFEETAEWTEQPVSVLANVNDQAVFHAAGNNIISWQWQVSDNNGHSWRDLEGENDGKLTMTVTEQTGNQLFRVIAKGKWEEYGNKLTSAPVAVLPKAVIIAQPERVNGDAGDPVTLIIDADNAIAYQWQVSENNEDWQLCAEGDSAVAEFLIPETILYYRCLVDGISGDQVISDVVVLSPDVKIISNPSDVSAAVGETAELAVSATGVKDYLWQYSDDAGETWIAVEEATGNACGIIITEEMAEFLTGRLYRCVVSGYDGTKKESGTVSIGIRAKITGQPVASSGKYEGDRISFEVTAISAEAYCWQVSEDQGTTWKNAGSDSAELILNSASLAGSRFLYRCEVTGPDGQPVYSEDVSYSLRSWVTAQTANAAGCIGETVSMKVTATGTESFLWQILEDGNWEDLDFPGADTDTLEITINEENANRKLRCVTTGTDGEAMYYELAEAWLFSRARIETQPQNQTATLGGSVVLSLEETGAVSYLWQYDEGEDKWTNCAEGSSKEYHLTADESAASRSYRCVLTGGDGTQVVSDPVRILIPVHVLIQPEPVQYKQSVTASFSVNAGAVKNYQWQWSADQKEWTKYTGNGNQTGSMSVKMTDASRGYYRCLLTGWDGETVCTDTVYTVWSGISLTDAEPGQTAVLAVTAVGNPQRFAWQVEDVEDETLAGTQLSLAGRTDLYGKRIRCAITDISGIMYESNRMTVDCQMTGHDWGETTYEWNADNSKVTATRECSLVAEHIETETVSVTPEITKAATCEAEGEKTYTSAAFENTAFAAQTKTVDVPALGHDWGKPNYSWNEDNTKVTAIRVCSHDAAHAETEEAETYRELVTAPAEKDTGTYQIVSNAFENAAFKIQIRSDLIIPALEDMNVLNLPESIKKIETEAFEGTAAEAIIIPDECTTIEPKAFINCMYLLYIRVPAGVEIPDDAFDRCPNVIVDQQ